ncbi:MAG: tRNA (adenosine(37)-N6)-threonylcarbamoyltransferase complex transferase subunit TsaD [Verrucomicrobiia bacterium]
MASPFRGIILGIESSCDETGAALLHASPSGLSVLRATLASQIPEHRPYGGVVPELAARRHLIVLDPMVRDLLAQAHLSPADLDLIAATSGPGLASSLLIGLNYAKGLALAAGKPWIGVNHLQGHLASPFLTAGHAPTYPHLGLIISGGHTLLARIDQPGTITRLGATRDDAAGEAFDKVAKLLGLGYPGGPAIEKRAALGKPDRFPFPRGLARSGDFDFSFSGLKTAVRTCIASLPPPLDDTTINDLCASFQEAVISVLLDKTFAAARAHNATLITVSGGVSANRTLASRFLHRANTEGIPCLVAPPSLSTDNAVMIAAAAALTFQPNSPSPWHLDVDPNLPLASP